MKYVDWVEHVLLGLRDAKAAQASPSIYLSDEALAEHLGVADKERGVEAVRDALRDLERLSAVETPNYYNVLLTSEGKRLAKQSMRALWPKAEDTWLDDTQVEYLTALIDMSEWRAETHASLDEVDENDLVARLEWATRDDVNVDLRELRIDLRDRGLINGRLTLGNTSIYPTYGAIVKLTELHTLADTELVRSLLRQWEGVNVDFKRQLSLKTKDDKAEFVKDVLSLANPQVVGDRYLVIGFDNKTHKFAQSVNPKVEQDHMENLLNEYTESEHSGQPVGVRFRHVAWTDPAGVVGLIEVLREATEVPYRVKTALMGAENEIRLHQISVRHSSHIAEPDDEELAGLRAEAEWARGVLGLAPVGVRSKARSGRG